MHTPTFNLPRSLRSLEEITRRRLLLREPHIAPLTAYVQGLRQTYPDCEFPDFDPLDAGCNAQMLFLLEKPGPMTSTNGKGSGFISRDNDDPTAAALFNFMTEAGIDRKEALLWNVIPGWNGTRKVTPDELRTGVEDLRHMLALLPQLRKIVLVGNHARRARPLFAGLPVTVYESAHPSPIVRGTNRAAWQAIPLAWAAAKRA